MNDVRRISAREAELALHTYTHAPVVIEGLALMAPLGGLDDIIAEFAGRTLSCVDTRTDTYTHVPAADLLRGIAAGERQYNIINSSLLGTPLEAIVTLPPFLRDNWLGGGWPGTAEDIRVRQYALSLVATAADTFTPLHVDSNGLSGWMQLCAGRKHWWIYPPAERALLGYADGGAPADPRGGGIGAGLTTTIGPGDLIFIPPGWLHAVATPELSFGLGGSYLHTATADAALASWRADIADGFPPTLDLAGLVRHHAAN